MQRSRRARDCGNESLILFVGLLLTAPTEELNSVYGIANEKQWEQLSIMNNTAINSSQKHGSFHFSRKFTFLPLPGLSIILQLPDELLLHIFGYVSVVSSRRVLESKASSTKTVCVFLP